MMRPETLVGKQIDQFRLDEYIAMGGMGIVYKAHDTVLNRMVALKLISKTDDVSPAMEEARRRLIKEARAAAGLFHDNIVTIFSYGETDSFQYIAMEYVKGKTLEQVLIERDLLPPREAVPIFDQILLALEAADEQEIVHRDIKPSNIMITTGGRIKVMDFGIARVGGHSTTVTGMVLGTPEYMAPEQIRGAKTDTRSDIFAVGVLLYNVLTGTKPFDADSITALMYKILEDEPIPPQDLNQNLPLALARVITKAMSKDPADRYQTPGEMRREILLADLDSSADATVIRPSAPGARQTAPSSHGLKRAPEPGRPAVAPPVKKAPRPPQQYILGAIALLALCGLVFLLWRPLADQFVRTGERDQPVGTDTTPVRPDGREVKVETGAASESARLDQLENALQGDGSNALIKSQLADLYYETKRFPDAARLYSELNQSGKSRTTSERLVLIYKTMDRADEALAAYIDLINLTEDRQIFDEFMAYLNKSKQGDEAGRYLEKHRNEIPKAFQSQSAPAGREGEGELTGPKSPAAPTPAAPVSPLASDTKRQKSVSADTPEPPAEPTAKQAPGGLMFAVQLGSFKDSESAETMRRNLTKKGYSIVVSSIVSPRGGMTYIVRTAPVDGLSKASELAAQLKREIKTTPKIVRMTNNP